MRLYIKQRVFSWGSKFDITDESGRKLFLCAGEVFSWGKKLHIYDENNVEVVFIRQRLLSFMPKYEIYIGGNLVATLIKKFTFTTHDFYYDGINWEIDGDFFAHDYRIRNNGEIVMRLTKRWFSWGDSYEIDINPKYDTLLCLASSIVIDCVCHEDNGN